MNTTSAVEKREKAVDYVSDEGIHWVRTLCDSCHEDRIKKAIEKRKKMDENS